MNCLYIVNYLGKEFVEKYCQGKKYALSGIFKSQGIARALMSAGHNVTIYSPGITTCGQDIPSFTEYENYPEGILTIKYCNVKSYPRFSPLNEWRVAKMVRKTIDQYDAVVYYNISMCSCFSIGCASKKIRILEYEDNIFNKALVGDKNRHEWLKTRMYNYIMKRIDGLMAVCNGLMLSQINNKVLTPGIVSEVVVKNVSSRVNTLKKGQRVKIILTGGTHYSKGSDLFINAMKYVKTPCDVEFYGNGEFYQAALDEIQNVPAIHTITNKGFMPHEELIKILNETADILINTTRSMHVGAQAAGFPFKMMEYASTGRPIVSSEIGKLDEKFNSHITYYNDEDPKAIALAIEEVIENYDVKVKSALELQKIAINDYCIEGIGKKLNDFIERIQK